MLEVLVMAGTVLCAALAIRANRLIVSALWLAGASALISIVFYRMGAPELAVIELSVGAGLVTILFVFAISIAGDDAITATSLLPRPVSLGLVIAAAALLAWMCLPAVGVSLPGSNELFATVLWQQRGLDVLMQVVLVFAGVMGILGLLSESKDTHKARPVSHDQVAGKDDAHGEVHV
jgi:uncharacterized MnhB-related membrane protein